FASSPGTAGGQAPSGSPVPPAGGIPGGDSGSTHGIGRSRATRTVLMPSLSGRWKVSERFSLDGFARRTFRMPTFNDLYYTTVGSKSLLPEDALQFSFGAAWSPLSGPEGDLSLKADVYRNYLRNKIIAVPTSNQFRWSMYNLGKVRMTGAELAGEYSRTVGRVGFGLAGRWSFQRASDLSDRDALTWKGQIPYIPLHSGSADLYATFDGWRLDLICFATGERFSTSANLPAYRLAPWTSLDAALAKEFKVLGRQATARLSLNNLLDEQYEVVDNYPMPGFNAMLNLEVGF
ncbi:MAG: TonB-dependent receptor, partial [Bacteroidales bacterium]|nr:TonB-dependent receptor [Bacteroidales bacterium]